MSFKAHWGPLVVVLPDECEGGIALCVPLVVTLKHGQWVLHCRPFGGWRRERGGFPHAWRDYGWQGPVATFWHLGPFELVHLRSL